MSDEIKRAVIGIPLSILIGAGVAAAGSFNGARIGSVPVFALCIAVAFSVQWLAFIPAYINQTEIFFDLTGSLTYITVMIVAVVATPDAHARAYLLAGMVLVWAGRLGTFLFARVRKAGEDSRFREIKTSFLRFFLVWTIQGLWVSFTAAAALATITTTRHVDLGIFAVVGFLVWLFGFVIEVVADRQKKQFKADPANKGDFIDVGLWKWSRHPNYFGEIVLWIGVAIIALPVLSGWQWVTLISPLFVTVLLTRVSGIPMLEESADERWGGQPDYEAYKQNTPVLVPKPPQS